YGHHEESDRSRFISMSHRFHVPKACQRPDDRRFHALRPYPENLEGRSCGMHGGSSKVRLPKHRGGPQRRVGSFENGLGQETHSIPSSARASSVGGLAVIFRLRCWSATYVAETSPGHEA